MAGRVVRTVGPGRKTTRVQAHDWQNGRRRRPWTHVVRNVSGLEHRRRERVSDSRARASAVFLLSQSGTSAPTGLSSEPGRQNKHQVSRRESVARVSRGSSRRPVSGRPTVVQLRVLGPRGACAVRAFIARVFDRSGPTRRSVVDVERHRRPRSRTPGEGTRVDDSSTAACAARSMVR
jgi:hypothetical protein